MVSAPGVLRAAAAGRVSGPSRYAGRGGVFGGVTLIDPGRTPRRRSLGVFKRGFKPLPPARHPAQPTIRPVFGRFGRRGPLGGAHA